MRNAETVLAVIHERGRRGLHLEDVYRQLFNPDLYLRAYNRIGRNAGAMTRGTSGDTVDGMSMERIHRLIEDLRFERLRWSPVRRVLIPKTDGKTRPLGIPNFYPDRLLQEVMRSILEAYYEPQFSPRSHGFRPERGCFTALRDITTWTGTRWFIEGDIKGCFDNIDHSTLMEIVGENIRDNRFLRLLLNMLEAGYLEEWTWKPTLSGTPQGGVISPILANIYLDRLDKFVETLIPEFHRGKVRRRLPEYHRAHQALWHHTKLGKPEEYLEPLRRKLQRLDGKVTDDFDADYRRLKYVRYADDFILGFSGPRSEAESIKLRIKEFLGDRLKLELSEAKTLITHARTGGARFLGYDVTARYWSSATRGIITLRLPPKVLEAKKARYMANGKVVSRPELKNDSDFAIVELYGQEYRGFVGYYALAMNRYWLQRLEWIMGGSLLKTLACKHQSSTGKMAKRFRSANYDRGKMYRCLAVEVERAGKTYRATFGGLRLTRDETMGYIPDRPFETDRLSTSRADLLQRLAAGECELCGSKDDIQVHHIRKLADLQVRGQRAKSTWAVAMATRRRKTLVVCYRCHNDIHAGRPTRSRPP
jgi:group II intron reverse transcriptase/maturase